MTEQQPQQPQQRTNRTTRTGGYSAERVRISSDSPEQDTEIRHRIKSEAVRVAPRTGHIQPSRNQKRTLISAEYDSADAQSSARPTARNSRTQPQTSALPLTQQQIRPARTSNRPSVTTRVSRGQDTYVRQSNPTARRSVSRNANTRNSRGGSGIGRIIVIVIIAAALIALIAFALTHLPSCEKKEAAVEAQATSVNFVAVGDNLPDDLLGQWADEQAGTAGDGEYDYTGLFTHIASYVQAADLAYCKQETHCGGDENGAKGYPSFNTTDAMADAIVSTGFDLVASASNHCYDWGLLGANEHSCELWATKDVVFTGTYTSEEAYNTIATTTVNDITFSLLDYTYGVNGFTEDELPAYTVKFIDKDLIKSDVERAQEISDVVMVAMHWGTENQFEPDETQLEYAQYLADLGVDIILGSHPHVIGAMTWLEGSDGNKTLCAYSLGNFLSRHETPTRINELEGMLSCTFVKTPVPEEDPDASASPSSTEAQASPSSSASTTQNGSASTVTRTHNGYTISIENVTWTPLVNHTNIEDSTYGVYAVKDYPESLAATHDYFDGDGAEALTWLRSKTREVVNSLGYEFTINDTSTETSGTASAA